MPEKNTVKAIDLDTFSFSDERGWVTNPFEAVYMQSNIPSFFHVVSTKPGYIRGNHYHSNTTEWVVVCDGPALMAWRSIDSDIIQYIGITSLTMFEIPPNIAHAILNTGKKDIVLISFCDSDKRDTIKCEVLFQDIEEQ